MSDEVHRVNHSHEYKAEDGANVNQAESFFSRMRRAETGQHHRISGHLLHQYANEASWREDDRCANRLGQLSNDFTEKAQLKTSVQDARTSGG